MTSTETLVQRSTDARGVVTLTLNRPAAFNSLSEGMLEALQAELDGVAADERRAWSCIAAAGKAFCAGHDLKEMRAEPSLDYYERLFAQCGAGDADDPEAAGAGDRARARHRHRRRLPARGDVRPGRGQPRCALCRQRRQPRPVLLDAERGAVAQPVAQGGLRDAGHRRLHQRRRGAAKGLVNRVAAPRQLDAEVERWSRHRGQAARGAGHGQGLFYRQLEKGIAAAYDDAGQTMACNMMDEARARRRAGLHRQAAAGSWPCSRCTPTPPAA
jgi:enoyl-CoA hydratase/carnithine racemase